MSSRERRDGRRVRIVVDRSCTSLFGDACTGIPEMYVMIAAVENQGGTNCRLQRRRSSAGIRLEVIGEQLSAIHRIGHQKAHRVPYSLSPCLGHGKQAACQRVRPVRRELGGLAFETTHVQR